MKSQAARQAKQILALGLLSSLALLTACGGGGKSAPAAVEPASSGPVVKTVLEAADPNEPYLASASSYSTGFIGGTSYKQKDYTLKVVDGVLQKVIKEFPLGTTENTGLWRVLSEAVQTSTGSSSSTVSASIAHASATTATTPSYKWVDGRVLFIQNGSLFQFDLKRKTSTQTAVQLSSLTKACAIVDTYRLTPDNAVSGVIVSTMGSDSICGNSNDESVVIATNATASTAAATPLDAKARILTPMFDSVGVIKGVLAQQNSSATKGNLALLSPDLSSALVAKVTLKQGDKDVSDFATSADDSYKAQWITHAPSATTAGYVRIRPDTTTAPLLFKLSLTTDIKVKSEITELALLDLQAHVGIRDGNDVYIVNGPYVVKSVATDTTGLTFELLKGDWYTPGLKDKLISVNLTPKHLLVGIQKDKTVEYWAINKSTASTNLIGIGSVDNNFRLLGIKGEVALTAIKGSDNPASTDIYRADMDAAEKESSVSFSKISALNNSLLVSALWSNEASDYGPQLDALATCTLGSSTATYGCNSKAIKLYSPADDAITWEMGTVSATDAYEMTFSGSGRSATSNVVQVYKKKPNLDMSNTIWVFHPGAARSLKEPTPIPVPPAASAPV